MDLSIRRDRVAGQNYRWAASADGFNSARGGTIDITTLDPEDHYPDGFIESGFAVGVISATGKLGPYDPDANDGRDTPVGVVIDAHTIGSVDISVSYLNRGQLHNQLLPFPFDADGIEALTHFIIHGEPEGGS